MHFLETQASVGFPFIRNVLIDKLITAMKQRRILFLLEFQIFPRFFRFCKWHEIKFIQNLVGGYLICTMQDQ